LPAVGKAYLAGAIGILGSKYVLESKAVNCQNGDSGRRTGDSGVKGESWVQLVEAALVHHPVRQYLNSRTRWKNRYMSKIGVHRRARFHL